ncbi:MAG: tetratricopeptide repeat protein [Desulfobacteraceae bacterium]|nr:tetratricopeptide repeat protein [Desulfobacteraceae bacterium]MBC2751976.1 tetratricopeptide repeat protein [Desulfobacteraceae bacterium]
MKYYSTRFWTLVLLLQTILFSCRGLRTEIYREETRHRYNQACKLYKQGDYQTARSELENIIGLDPDYGQAHAALGNLALIGEDYAGALAYYQEAVAVDPELEADLRPLIMVAGAHEARAPLQKAGVGLDQIYQLIMGDRRAEVEALLAKDIPLQLLANDTMGITPGRLGAMQRKLAEAENPMIGSVRYRLFSGYFLFYGQNDDALATAVIHSAVDGAAGRERQEALVVLGKLHARQGETNEAVDAYLAAVDAGLPMTEVAHHLARVYRVDIESILLPIEEPADDAVSREPMRIEISTYLPSPPGPELGSVSDAKNPHLIERRGSPYTF